MRRRLAQLGLVGALGLGCASPTPLASSPDPAAAPPSPRITVRAVPPAAFTDPARREKIAALLPEIREVVAQIVAADELVGLAVGVVVDDELVLGEGFGARHATDGGAIDTHTVFRIGSITKVFTAMTALRLWEAGRLDLDGPAAEVLPELDTLVYPSADARPLSVRDMLNHTGGLPLVLDRPATAPGVGLTRAALMESLVGVSLVRPPGTAYEYANLGFALLGHVIAAASGRPYHAAIHDAVLGPLGMRDTVWEPLEVPPQRLASGHVVVDGRVLVVPPSHHGDNDAAGGLLSTVDDLARLLAFQLAAWPPRSTDDDAPLRRATSRAAQRLQALRSFRARTAPIELADGGVEGGADGVGWGWGVAHGCEHPYVVGHNGVVNGYHATVRMLPFAGVGVIVLANASWADTDHIADEIQRALARGGALALRAPQALPELGAAAERVMALLDDWDEPTFAAWSTRQLGTGSAATRLAARMRWLHAALGACTLGPLRRATSAWSGVYRASCERGDAELTLALTSAASPKIASVSVGWLDGAPEPALHAAAVAAADLLEHLDGAKFRALFSRGFNRSAMDRIVARLRFERGACRLARATAIRGPEDATYALDCDRGAARMTLTLDRGQPARIVAFQVRSAGALPACR